MIDPGEHREAGRRFRFDRGFKSRDGLLHRILARLGDQAGVDRQRRVGDRAQRER
jgi:hypothetical protein